MGLDMYLYKVKKKGHATLGDLVLVKNYLSYLDREEKDTFKQWCGVDESEIDMKLVELYKEEFRTQYYPWDIGRKYPYKSILTMICNWTKSYQVHEWFVENVQDGIDDCDYHEVSKEKLEQLFDLCDRMSSQIINDLFHEETEDRIEVWNHDDVQYLEEHLREILEETDFEKEMIIYRASW